jgi:hypothetical protein
MVAALPTNGAEGGEIDIDALGAALSGNRKRRCEQQQGRNYGSNGR